MRTTNLSIGLALEAARLGNLVKSKSRDAELVYINGGYKIVKKVGKDIDLSKSKFLKAAEISDWYTVDNRTWLDWWK